MGCGTNTNGNGSNIVLPSAVNQYSVISINRIADWDRLRNADPEDPINLIADAKLDGIQGVYMSSSTFLHPAGYGTNDMTFPVAPYCEALRPDDEQQVADAAQWNFQHLTSVSSGIPPQMYSLLFLRAGTAWKMVITMDFAGSMKDMQLTFFENAATLGNFHEEIPVISFTKGDPYFTGTIELEVTLKKTGKYRMGLRGIDDGDSYFFWDMLWIVVP